MNLGITDSITSGLYETDVLWQACENYLNFHGRRFTAIAAEDANTYILSKEKQEPFYKIQDVILFLTLTLKVVTYCSVVIPLIALAYRHYHRKYSTFILPPQKLKAAALPVHPLQGTPIKANPTSSQKSAKLMEKVHAYPGDIEDFDAIFYKVLKKRSSGLHRDIGISITFPNADNFNVTIRCQDIFQSGAQVVVNACNTDLGDGAGINGLIHKHGKSSYTKEQEVLRGHYLNGYTEGFASMIGCGDLKSMGFQNVIVIAGPSENNRLNYQEFEIKKGQLYSCYRNALKLAHREGKTSIAFPSISTGIFSFPEDEAAKISLRAIADFIQKNPDSQLKTISIHFLPHETRNLDFYKDALAKAIQEVN